MKNATMTKQYPTDRLFALPRLITLDGLNTLASRAPKTRKIRRTVRSAQ